MTETMWVRSHVERLLQDEWDAYRVAQDSDGDYPFRRGTPSCWVSIVEADDVPFVHVFAIAATGLKPTAAVLRELNDIQMRCLTPGVLLTGGRVIIRQTVSPIGLTQPVLAQAMNAVGGVADDIGLLLAGMFGGATPYPVEMPQPEEKGEDAA